MVDYFIVNYVRLEHGFIFLTANYFIAAGVPFALTDLGKGASRRAVFFLMLKMLCCVAAGEVVASLYHWISGGEAMLVPLVVGVAVTAVYAAAFSKLKMPVRLMRAAEYFGISQLAIGITSSIGGVLGLAYSYLQWVLICVNLIVIASGTIFIKYFSAEQGIKMHVMFPVAVVVINAMCLVFVILAALRYITSDAALVLSILFTFIDLLVYAAVTYIVRRLWSEPRKEAERLQRESERELLRMSETRLEEMRRLRHELKNQYAYMRVLLEEKEYGKLDKYFSELSDKIADTVDYTDCGNSTINAIIAAERSRVDRAGAELVCRITVPPVLGVSDIDLCSLIMNLVNNAAEYLERSPDLHDRKIEADISLSGHTLLVKISNALSDRDREHALMLETSKADKRYHGHGTRIVRSIAEKYGGAAVFAAEGGRFVAAVTLTEITSGGGRRKTKGERPIYENHQSSRLRRRRKRMRSDKRHRESRFREKGYSGGCRSVRDRVFAAQAHRGRGVRPYIPGYRHAGYGRHTAGRKTAFP